MEDLLFIEPKTVCVNTNLTLDFTINLNLNLNNTVIVGDIILGNSYISPGLSYISPAKAALGLITPHSLATRATVHFYA
jgi:hypothetical protein